VGSREAANSYVLPLFASPVFPLTACTKREDASRRYQDVINTRKRGTSSTRVLLYPLT
jgi:hypothetical protein